MKILSILLCVAISVMSCKNDIKVESKGNQEIKSENTMREVENIYQFKVKDISGDIFDFSTLKGKKIMIDNTASKCGLTPQYKQLQEIYKLYGGDNFEIIGFPANNFGKQEPGTNQEIASFCKENFGVSFPMMSKISVKGDDKHELYQFLTEKERNGFLDSEVSWNFQKYLLDEKGELVKLIAPKVLPDDDSIVNWIKG